MTTLQINFFINGQETVITEADVQNGVFGDALALLDAIVTTPVTFTNGYMSIEGTAVKSVDELTIMVALSEAIVSPRGWCITFTPEDDDTITSTACEQPTLTTIKDSLKLAVVDAEGCVVEYVTLASMRDYLLEGLITDACDLFSSESEQPLVSGDSIVAINGCTLKRITQSSIKCE